MEKELNKKVNEFLSFLHEYAVNNLVKRNKVFDTNVDWQLLEDMSRLRNLILIFIEKNKIKEKS